jgi:circadian clock protein KaiC
MLTREGLEEYVSDCVIVLDNRVVNQVSTRRLRVIKYRGSLHGTNEYPFLIDTDGISVLPVTSLKLEAQVSTSRISSGIPSLDGMLDKGGFYTGTSLLLSGTAGTGKTSVAASFANAACQRNERCIYFAFEESPQQIMRNMHSIGLKLETHVKKGLLKFQASRPTMYGLEMHLVVIHKIIREFKPQTVIIDPITNLTSIGSVSEVQSIITRLIDFLQMNQITTILTGLNYTSVPKEQTDETISSLVDAWIQLRDIEMNGERNRGLYIMKSRGMKHSNQIREVIISDKGLYLEDIYLGADGILTGTAREADRLYKQTEHVLREHILDRRKKELDRKGKELEAKIMALRTEFDHLKEGLDNDFIEEELKNELTADKQGEIKRVRENTTNKINNTIRRQKK